MPLSVDLAALKAQLRLDAVSTDEDALLGRLLTAATRSCAAHLDRPLDDPALTADDLVVIGQAVLVWATALYEDRDGGGEVPRAVVALLRPLQDLSR